MTAAELNIEARPELLAYLRDAGHILPREDPRIEVLAGGVSNRTVLVERASGEAWVLKQALAKLLVAVDWFSPPERIHREAAGLRWLALLAPPGATTRLVFEDTERHVLAMEAVPQPHDNWKTLLLAGKLDLGHVDQFGQLLGTIHRAAYARRHEIAPVFDDRSFFESLRVEPYYCFAAERVPAAGTFLRALVDETRATRLTLVHGDYSPKNILVHRDKLVLLDHEVIHWGDPAFDLGFSLAHLLSKAHHLSNQRAAFAAAAQRYWRAYRATLDNVEWGSRLEARAARHTLGCLLARVTGRSPLEYLDARERQRQLAAVLELLEEAPSRVPDLVEQFVERIDQHAGD